MRELDSTTRALVRNFLLRLPYEKGAISLKIPFESGVSMVFTGFKDGNGKTSCTSCFLDIESDVSFFGVTPE